jgi:phosphoribosylanthranilate isomerase
VTRIKICGITRVQDAELAVSLGAWAIGLILWPPSPRHCRRAAAVQIAAAVRRRTEVAGVFVNPTLEQVARAAEEIGLDVVQLHGEEGPAFCAEVARRTGAKVIKAARVRSGGDIQALEPYHTDFHLLDGPGGGRTFDWELARRRHARVPLILSGALSADNVAAAIAAVRPFAVDVASGVESAPGIKDPDALAAFAAAVAQAGPHAARPRGGEGPPGPPAHAPAGAAAHARPPTATNR